MKLNCLNCSYIGLLKVKHILGWHPKSTRDLTLYFHIFKLALETLISTSACRTTKQLTIPHKYGCIWTNYCSIWTIKACRWTKKLQHFNGLNILRLSIPVWKWHSFKASDAIFHAWLYRVMSKSAIFLKDVWFYGSRELPSSFMAMSLYSN